ncbi:phosphoribosylanthranilate isomerase [Paenibacillus sp. 481]|uniref:phosphoribosylanthranilate isomerase n=1 Tax=Paenibacillus sp. 481 TaxID=2835869 RepID=UPI001E5B651F|nr:phosphoribosylanthranilate isomerase [Paenibacillus sp. 481]UHA72970.1 phosphoribosylanthranilate isomerase [Paenibacillus sp. 481]
MTFVKICGLQDVETARVVTRLKPDQIGFVFAPSRRQIAPSLGSDIIQQLRAEFEQCPEFVGVFASPKKEELAAVLNTVPLDAIQLHMPLHVPVASGVEATERAVGSPSEGLQLLKWIKSNWDVRIWLTVPISTSILSATSVERDADPALGGWNAIVHAAPYTDVLLLDTHDPIQGGGSGKTFNWSVIPNYMEQAKTLSLPLYAAGGLDPNNVSELTASYPIAGVDVSSGVETNGVKDTVKIKSFIERVRGNVIHGTTTYTKK